MGIIGTLQVFESAFIMTGGEPNDSTLFYCFYLFNQAFRYLDMAPPPPWPGSSSSSSSPSPSSNSASAKNGSTMTENDEFE